MVQIFEVTWSEGTVTPELISSLLRQYVTQGGLYGTVVVKEAAQQSVQADGNCPYCQYPSFDEGGKLLDHCAACSRPRR